nr:MAG TPA: hypothetical protein [Caudoviricetes sp.]
MAYELNVASNLPTLRGRHPELLHGEHCVIVAPLHGVTMRLWLKLCEE